MKKARSVMTIKTGRDAAIASDMAELKMTASKTGLAEILLTRNQRVHSKTDRDTCGSEQVNFGRRSFVLQYNREMVPGSRLVRIICISAHLGMCMMSFGQQQSKAHSGGRNPLGATRLIFDQNNRKFYSSSTQQMVQFPNRGRSLPYGQFAVYVSLEDETGKFISALQPKPSSFENLRTGYYVLPQPPGGALNAFGLVINADDPHNHHGDISYVMPCNWLSDVTMPRDKILSPWKEGFDSIEYAVDMRVPFAHSTNFYHRNVVDNDEDSPLRPDFAAPYVLGGLYFEQLRKLGGTTRPPAFWIAVTLFDLRKHYSREVLIVDNWSGGTNYPIVTTAIGREVIPDNGLRLPDLPPEKPIATSTPTYSFTLPGSESMQTESRADGPFQHFAVRITREHFLAAIDGIRTRLPSAYGEHGIAPISTDLADWGITHFNFDAEIFHHSTISPLPPIGESRAMVVELKNLQIQQSVRSPESLTVRGALERIDGLFVQGYACFDADSSEPSISSDQLANLRDTPVSVELLAVDSSKPSPELSLGRVSARLPVANSGALCSDRRNGHSFAYRIPLERILRIREGGQHMIIKGRAFLGSGKTIPLQDPPGGPIEVPAIDFPSYATGLLGSFDGVKGRTASGWACLTGKEDYLPIEILIKPTRALDGPGTFLVSGYADAPSQPIPATWQACGDHGPHHFNIQLPANFALDDGQTLVAIARPGNYSSPSPSRPWDKQLPQSDPEKTRIVIEPPQIKGYFESVKTEAGGILQMRGWACAVGSEQKLHLRVIAMLSGERAIQLKAVVADRASEAAVQRECEILNSAGDPGIRGDGKGFRFDVRLDPKSMPELVGQRITDVRVEAESGNDRTVPIAKVPGWSFDRASDH
jgi:hypothetical protein